MRDDHQFCLLGCMVDQQVSNWYAVWEHQHLFDDDRDHHLCAAVTPSIQSFYNFTIVWKRHDSWLLFWWGYSNMIILQNISKHAINNIFTHNTKYHSHAIILLLKTITSHSLQIANVLHLHAQFDTRAWESTSSIELMPWCGNVINDNMKTVLFISAYKIVRWKLYRI